MFFLFFKAVHIVPQLLFVTTAIIIFQLTYPLENVCVKVTFLTKKKVMLTPNVNN